MPMLIELPYIRERAVEYALRWALSRNPLFPDFAGIGGDCTNFVSQAILAGSCVMNDTLDFGWYYFSPENRAPAWTGVQFFYNFITGNPEYLRENGGEGQFGAEAPTTMIEPGDVVQLANEQGTYYHTLMITGREGDDFLVSAHTDDARNRPLINLPLRDRSFLAHPRYALATRKRPLLPPTARRTRLSPAKLRCRRHFASTAKRGTVI